MEAKALYAAPVWTFQPGTLNVEPLSLGFCILDTNDADI
jgi:hypothetical protein